MYIEKISLKNIRSFEDNQIEIEAKSGWHVFLGENGAGKSTLIKSMALALVGNPDVAVLGYKQSWKSWLRSQQKEGNIKLEIKEKEACTVDFGTNRRRIPTIKASFHEGTYFSAAYGSFRRLTGGNPDYENIWDSNPDLAAHLSVFGEDVALDQSVDWLCKLQDLQHLQYFEDFKDFKDFEDLQYFLSFEDLQDLQDLQDLPSFENLPYLQYLQYFKSISNRYPSLDKIILALEKKIPPAYLKKQQKKALQRVQEQIEKNKNNPKRIPVYIQHFINTSIAIPNGFFMDIKHDNIYFKKNGLSIPIQELSDGYKSVLSLVLELLRQLFRFHEDRIDKVFKEEEGKVLKVIAKGTVLIDEVDTHLHPSWQAKIGTWLTTYFPNIQFIVTTHSPIICRAAAKGSIHKIYNEEGKSRVEKLEGLDKEQLIYGNILDAFETGLFGKNISRSKESLEKMERLAELSGKKLYAMPLTADEQKELKELSKLLPTDDINSFLFD